MMDQCRLCMHVYRARSLTCAPCCFHQAETITRLQQLSDELSVYKGRIQQHNLELEAYQASNTRTPCTAAMP